MRTPRLFVDGALAPRTTVTLRDAQAHYLRNVLRCRDGDPLTLFNGEGGEYRGAIANMGKKEVSVDLDAFIPANRESHLTIKLGLGITKRDSMDAALQKSTELGATEITPLLSEYTSIPERSLATRHSHWLQITRSACEQCERNRTPRLNEPVSASEWISTVTADLKLVAHPGDKNGLADKDPAPRSIAVLIGPEGGVSERELALAAATAFVPVSLGPRILRADTAPVAMLALIQAKWGDLGGL